MPTPVGAATDLTQARPRGVTALAVFFGIGAVISLASSVSLLLPDSPLEPMWRLNPRAHEAFQRMGPMSPVLLAAVCAACSVAAVGLWRGKPWGHRVAAFLLVVNLLGDVSNVVLGVEPRGMAGIPIVAVLLIYLMSANVRSYFRRTVLHRSG